MTKEVIFEGIALYANVPPRPAQKALETDDTSYSIQVECSADQFKALRKEGIPALTQLKTFPDDYVNSKTGKAPEVDGADGKTFIRIKASKYRANTKKGPITFADIPVVDEDGNTVEVAIANGSKVRVLAHLEDLKGVGVKKALRLKAVVVTNLIPYEGGGAGSALAALGVKKAATASKSSVVDEDSDFLGA